MNVSFQLYSARDFTPWAEVFSMLAGLGYTQVEGFAGNYDDPAATRNLLDQNGLSMPSGHFFPIGSFESDLETTLATARTLGMTHLFCPAPGMTCVAAAMPRPGSPMPGGWKRPV